MSVTIWHNPRCSKSRQTLALLEDRALAPTIRLYLQDPPTADEIRTALRALNRPASALVRSGETIFKELGLSKTSAEDDLIDAMAMHPVLIERPVVFAGGKARIGRPPEDVLELL